MLNILYFIFQINVDKLTNKIISNVYLKNKIYLILLRKQFIN